METKLDGYGTTCYLTNEGIINQSVTGIGYSGTGYYQYKSSGKVQAMPVSTYSFRSSNGSQSGFSGGPILNSNNSIIGVIHGKDDNGNCWGVRITEDMIALINELNK